MRPFTYQKAATAADAVSAIAAGGAGTRFLAGGTTLYDLMKLNVEVPSHIVDINSLSELEAFDTSGSNELVLGALARMSDVAADPRFAATVAQATGYVPRSILAMPLETSRRVLGVIEVLDRAEHRARHDVLLRLKERFDHAVHIRAARHAARYLRNNDSRKPEFWMPPTELRQHFRNLFRRGDGQVGN